VVYSILKKNLNTLRKIFSMDNNVAIRVAGVSKTFKLPHEKTTSLKGLVINFYKRNRSYEKQSVLKNVSFEIKKGEFFGIVGRNGSGKSTMLKLLAGIYDPDSGTIEIQGKLTPFIELGVGFNPELTGRENVFLNGALLGFNRREISEMYQDIVDFAEIEEFMDQKLKNYSSGMQVRLAFSVAIRAETDILLIDEVLAVGDQSFQEKCFDYFSQIKHSDKTVIFVTHDMSNVERFCDRVYVIDKKKSINGLYTIPQAVSLYNKLNHELSFKPTALIHQQNDSDVYIDEVVMTGPNGKKNEDLSCGKAMTIQIKIANRNAGAAPKPVLVGLAFYDRDGVNLAGPNSVNHPFSSDTKTVSYHIDRLALNMGEYQLTVALFDEKGARQYDLLDKQVSFFVNSDEVHHGKVVFEDSWT
jgi:ABC-type polysaccharide/polyol phosphate transport system ATPase subunit